MNSIAIRELARIQSVLHVLKNQRDNLSELSDISAFRGLEESCREDLQEAQKRGLVPQDPVSLVRADWCRLSTWSNRIQVALGAADDLGSLVETAGSKADQESGKKKKKSDTGWAPTLVELQRLRTALEAAPRVLEEAMELGRVDLLASDWSNGRPYPELVEVADAMEWAEKLELAESPGAWAHGIGLRERPLVASRLAVERSSSSIERRLRSLKDRLARVVGLIQLHGQHAGTLEEVGRLTEAGQVETARRLIGTLQAAFGDLDYSAREQRLAQLEKQLKSQSEKVAETKKELQEIEREAGRFFAFPPIGLMRRGSVAQGTAEKVVAETAQIGKIGGSSEVDRMVSGWTTGLKSDLDLLQTLWMSRVRRWILGTTVFWLVVLVAGGVTFQQVRAGHERERQRLAAEAKATEEKALAEAKAAEEKALAEARAKAEAEEKERQRLAAIAEQEGLRVAAEAKAKAEAEERERQRVAAEAKAAEEAADKKRQRLATIAEQERLRLAAEAKAKVEAVRARLVGHERSPGERVLLEIPVRWIPAGRYTMGSPRGEKGRDSDEVQHAVVLTQGFFLAETECSQAQWEVVMGQNPSKFKSPDRPVEQVTWHDAVEYCRKLTTKQLSEGILIEGWEWRLPTEAEWEYAARAGTTGARYGEFEAIAWHMGNSGQQTHAVKQKTANAWGLHDMMGNVWEWCSDWYGDYPTGSILDPTGPGTAPFRVLRGGGWFNDGRMVRSAVRNRVVPILRGDYLGFRPALSSVR